MFESAFDEYPRWYRTLVKCFWFLFPENYQRIKIREINGYWPNPHQPELPENIQWQNMGYSQLNRFLRQTIVWIIAVVIIICAFAGILYFKGVAESTKLVINPSCPSEITPNMVV